MNNDVDLDKGLLIQETDPEMTLLEKAPILWAKTAACTQATLFEYDHV